jgi:26S proteasome regulatory subunit T1
MTPEQITAFMDGVIRNRISLRLIAEHHIAITHDLKHSILDAGRVGVVDMACSPAQMIQICGSYVADLCEATFGLSPKIVVDGYIKATFAYACQVF